MKDPGTGAEEREFELTAQDTILRLEDGTTIEAWTFNGSTPGPELRVREGGRVVVKLINRDIDEGVTIHWHGVAVPCSQDGVAGVTQDVIWSGESFAYSFIADHPGTYWYHSHQESSEQAKKGLIGRIVIEPKENMLL
ncbi:FtsP/CotA-like multicopper oxidase with cupredoxin domain [Paenibacillus harenae]|nr:FtsP/CotA-like multicopper oxidase with cupredoxin domain [Paenibacillus harenae]